MHNNVNINVSGPIQPSSIYKTVVLKGNLPFALQVTEPNTKYIVKHNFDLEENTITFLNGCLLEIDGGSISNGTLVGNNTILIYNQPLNDILTATLEGTWRHENGVKADEEDMTSVNVGGTDVIKFKDKAYAPAAYSGMGRVYLRKNIVNGVNTLTQDMFYKGEVGSRVPNENTIFVIQYDYDLDGESITIPEGCVLKFEGGSLKNGKLVGQDTKIKAESTMIFNNIDISGTWVITHIYSKWFNADNKTIEKVLALNNATISTEINIDGDYELLIEIEGTSGLSIQANTTITISGILSKAAGSTEESALFSPIGDNITIKGGTLDGQKNLFPLTSEYGHAINIDKGINALTIDGVIIKECRGDGIYIGGNKANTGVVIQNCEIYNCRRQGISVVFAQQLLIENTYIHDIKGTNPQAGIDIEPNTALQLNEEIVISNCKINSCVQGILLAGTAAPISNVIIKGTKISLTNYNFAFSFNNGSNISIQNCDITLSGTKSTSYSIVGHQSKDIVFSNCKIETTLTTGSLFNEIVADFYSCRINTTENLFESLYSHLHSCKITCKGVCVKRANNGGFHDCTISGSSISLTYGTVDNPSKDVVIENNNITLTSELYAINIVRANNFQIRNNTMQLIGNRNLINIDSSNNIVLSSNRIIIGSNQNGVVFTSSKNCQFESNIVEIASGVSYTSSMVSGINKSSTSSNKSGDCFFDKGKILYFNGNGCVDVNGYTAAVGRGPTSSRPDFNTLYASDRGFQYYDEDLNKQIHLKTIIGNAIIAQTSIAKNVVDDVYYGVIAQNTLEQNSNYIYQTSYHTSRRFKAAFRKTNNTAYEDSDELLIAETLNADNLGIKAPDHAVYPYIFFCNLASDTLTVNAYIKEVTMSWAESDGAVAGVLRSGTFANKPSATDIYIGFRYFCTDKQTSEGATDGIEIIHKGNNVWVDALGRVVS